MIIIQLKKVFLGSWFWPDCSIVASTKDKLDFVFSLLLALATLLYCSDSTFAFCTNNQLRILRILLLDYFDYSSNMFQGQICGLQQKDLVFLVNNMLRKPMKIENTFFDIAGVF